MLRKGSLFFIIIAIFFSCKDDKYNKKQYFSFYKNNYVSLNFKKYSEIYIHVNDSISKWINNDLKITGLENRNLWKLDSILIFNKDSNCFFTVVLDSDTIYKNSTADNIRDFYGRRINGKWYFFFGATTVLPREFYQDSVYSPLSFEELSYLAYKERFEYFVDNKKPLPEDFFDDVLGAYHCKPYGAKKYDRTQVNLCLDSLALATHAAYHAKKMTKEEIAEIQKAMDESVRPPEPLKKSKEWWQFWKATPIFETEEWKNYLKQKYGKDWEKHR